MTSLGFPTRSSRRLAVGCELSELFASHPFLGQGAVESTGKRSVSLRANKLKTSAASRVSPDGDAEVVLDEYLTSILTTNVET